MLLQHVDLQQQIQSAGWPTQARRSRAALATGGPATPACGGLTTPAAARRRSRVAASGARDRRPSDSRAWWPECRSGSRTSSPRDDDLCTTRRFTASIPGSTSPLLSSRETTASPWELRARVLSVKIARRKPTRCTCP